MRPRLSALSRKAEIRQTQSSCPLMAQNLHNVEKVDGELWDRRVRDGAERERPRESDNP